MLYSEIKERENRFITALKIAFPFLLLIFIFFYSYTLTEENSLSFFLLILLIPIYVYYTVYLIYYGFQTSLIDPITKTFTRTKILKKIDRIKTRDKTTVVLIKLDNFEDIQERYGIQNADHVLAHFIEKLHGFFRQYHFRNIPIGRYSTQSFLFYIKHPQTELKHLLTLFSKNIASTGLDNIEIKVSFSLIQADKETLTNDLVEHLLDNIEDKKDSKKGFSTIKSNQFQAIMDEILIENRLSFKYQPSFNVRTKSVNFFEILTYLDSDVHGTLSKQQIQRMVNHMGCEKAFDEKVLECLLKEVKPLLINDNVISIEVSPVTLRNTHFKRFLVNLLKSHKVHPKHFILEINEQKSYEEMYRFKEIVHGYQELGFGIALGNFGGNNASFEYLKHLSIDLVKFDIEFTKKIEDKKFHILLKQYSALLKALHVQSMVKFVDKVALFEKIQQYEPDFIQGFYISKPKQIKEITHEIR